MLDHDAAYEPLLRRLRDRGGFAFGEARLPEVKAAAHRVMKKRGVDRVEHYVVEIDEGRLTLSDLIDEVTIGETYFFREPAHFAFLKDVVLPSLTAPFSIWSAGCASGEEAYSLAIVLRELGLGRDARVFGTDISREALVKARAANYGSWSFRGPDAERARPYLNARREIDREERWHLDETIQRSVVFDRLNLAADVYPANQQVIFCRNVLIYLDRTAIEGIARRLYDALADGGWLILASSDPPLNGLAPFHIVATDHGVFYRRLSATPRIADTPVPPALAKRRRESAPPALAPLPKVSVPLPTEERSSAAQSAFAAGDYAAAAALADPSSPLHVRALTNTGDLEAAEHAAARAILRSPLNAELQHLHGLIFVALERPREAVASLRRALYLDSKFIMAHFTLGTTLQRLGEPAEALRAFRNVRQLCAARPGDYLVPQADGASASHIAALATRQETP